MQGKTEQLIIPGAAGDIEAVLFTPEADANKLFVMCHPHPLFQGSMDNKVVTTMTRALAELGFTTLRFNYRGVGKSAGEYDHGIGEVTDTLTVLDYLQQRFGAPKTFVLGGFSFGGFVAYQTAIQQLPNALILVSPSIAKLNADTPEPLCPTLVIQGDSDETIPAETVYAWLKTRKNSITVKEIIGASHFFHGKLLDLRDIAQDFIKGLAL
jgi:alpha/beta superfamily hydrolase